MKLNKVLMLIIILSIAITGCSNIEGYQMYKDAMAKGEKIQSGSGEVHIKANLDFNTNNLDKEKIEELSYIEEVLFDCKYNFDDYRVVANSYYNMGGIGINADYYQVDKGSAYLKMPLYNKYFFINIKDQTDKASIQNFDISAEVFKPFIDKWIEVLNEEDVVVGKDTILETSSGQVKAKQISINITKEQLKDLFSILINIVTKEEFINKVDGLDIDKKEAMKYLQIYSQFLNDIELEKFSGISYIDYDGYIIYEKYELSVGVQDSKSGWLERMNLSYEYKIDGINKKQELVFPEINSQDIIDINNVDFNEMDFKKLWEE